MAPADTRKREPRRISDEEQGAAWSWLWRRLLAPETLVPVDRHVPPTPPPDPAPDAQNGQADP
jgi:hypothetical protein